MQVSTATINRQLITVIRRPFDAKAVRRSLIIGMPVVAELKYPDEDALCEVVIMESKLRGFIINSTEYINKCCFFNTLTFLPALPRHPKPEDAALLYRYASEGVLVYGDLEHELNVHAGCAGAQFIWLLQHPSYKLGTAEITRAHIASGERVDVAIAPLPAPTMPKTAESASKDMDMKTLLNDARAEIIRLRSTNEILEAKVLAMELFACKALEVANLLQKAIDRLQETAG